jgi:hypothetical protein
VVEVKRRESAHPRLDKAWAVVLTLILSLSGCLNDGGDSGPKAPVLAPIGAQTVEEGRTLVFAVTAAHPGGAAVTLSALGLPAGSMFTDGQFSWTPGYQDSGTYIVIFQATAAGLQDSESVTIHVRNRAQPPVFDPMADVGTTEGQFVDFPVAATSPEGDSVVITGLGLPQDGFIYEGRFSWFPTYLDSGTHALVFVATAGGSSDTDTVLVTVANTPVSYARDIQPIFNNQCIECHTPPGGLGYSETGGQFNNGLDLTETASYAKLLGTGQGAVTFQAVGLTPKWRIRPGDLNESYLLQKVDTTRTPKFGKPMPLDGFGGYVEPFNLAALKAWILEGAPNN